MSIVCNSPKFEVSSESSSYFNLHMPGTYMAAPASTDDNNKNSINNNNNNKQHNHNHNHNHQSSSNSSSSSSSSSSTSLSYSSSSSTSNNPSGYFDVKPLSSPAQTSYSDVQTPYFDALTSPFINNNFNSLNNDDINNHQQRHNQQIAFSSWLNSNNNNNNGGGVFTSTLPLTPSLFPNTSTTSSSSPYFSFSASQLPSSTLPPPPPQPLSSSSFIPSSLPTSSCSSLSSSSSSSSSSLSTSSSTSSASPTSLQKRHLLLKSSDNSLSNKRPNSMPSGSYFAFNSPFQEFSSETVESLLQQLDQQQRKTILLLDIRPYSSFSNDRIKSSIHLCAPTTLIKRPAFTIDSLLATLVNDADRQIFREWRAYENIIIYDNDTTTLTENSPIFHICKKFIPPAATTTTTTTDKGPKVKIGFLKGGFPSFSSKFPGLCEKVDSNNNNNNSGTFPRRRLSLGRKPGPFTCPTPVTESSNVNHFFNNIRQNIEGVAITETIPIRIPTQNNISLDQSKLPPFIRDVAFKDNGRMKLAELFLEIETTEQNRLKSLMIKNSNIATLDDPYSISAGIEKGTKNRYNNIWPYDHARVKINECKEGDCDYVNASFLQAKGSNKRYIATQGPLPTTYEDFWKIVWEQNSRLIVMLTKEEEAGRIQCHRYWSESASNPCGYGPLNLTLISESPMQITTTTTTTTTNNCNINKNGNLKFPPIDNTIIIRKFKLSHKNHPNIPPREVTQLHFLGWPDFGTPETPINILKLIDVANDLQSGAEVEAQRQHEQIGPMIVHCSAGCGRTGTFCTIDTVISILSSSSSNDYNDVKDIVQSTILNFREQRLSIVQNLRQFVFCYEAILWKLVGAI